MSSIEAELEAERAREDAEEATLNEQAARRAWITAVKAAREASQEATWEEAEVETLEAEEEAWETREAWEITLKAQREAARAMRTAAQMAWETARTAAAAWAAAERVT